MSQATPTACYRVNADRASQSTGKFVSHMKDLDYHHISRALRRDSWEDDRPLPLGDEPLALYNLTFTSRNAGLLMGRDSYECIEHDARFTGERLPREARDFLVRENIRFHYPLLRERSGKHPHRSDRAILLLHGLNERSFSKYLSWAYHLWSSLRAPVALFPIAFHVNRTPTQWVRDSETFEVRRDLPGNRFSHRFNALISSRIEEAPERMFWGAMQSYLDLADLLRAIRRDEHPHFAADARIDILGFSAGGYLSLLLALEEADHLLEGGRMVVFAGGVPARDLNLASPVILDTSAETALTRLFVKKIEDEASERMRHWLANHPEGRWFRALTGTRPDYGLLGARLRELSGRLLGIANVNDEVIPLGSMLNVLQGLRRDTGVRVVEFELGVHESPFVCTDHSQGRKFVSEHLDEERFGSAYRKFIDVVAAHFA